MARHSSDEGVYQVWEAISVLEQITFNWWEHSASENLFARKLHYERKRTAGYSFWPMGGWESLWKRVAAAFEGLGGTLHMPEKVERVIVRDGAVRGVELEGHDEPLEADEVVDQRARLGHARRCSTTARCPGTCCSGSSCWPTTRTRRAGSGTGSPPRSR